MKALLPELQEARSFYIFAIRALNVFKLLAKVLCCSYGEHRKTKTFTSAVCSMSENTYISAPNENLFSCDTLHCREDSFFSLQVGGTGPITPSPISKLALQKVPQRSKILGIPTKGYCLSLHY